MRPLPNLQLIPATLHACTVVAIPHRCGHCKRLAPEYEEAATALAQADPAIPLAKVDCPANSGLCGRFGVTGYPTLKIFRGGEFSADYSGPRTAGEGHWCVVVAVVDLLVTSFRWHC